jgi:hypothetical protein
MKKYVFSLLLLTIFTVRVTLGQDQSKWEDYWEKPIGPSKLHIHDQQIPGFFQSSALVWIRIYQKGISSQDLPSCVFHPSCSRFAFAAIENYGTVRGILLAVDRLMRCNPFAHKYYQFDGEKLSDPVYRYDIKKYR